MEKYALECAAHIARTVKEWASMHRQEITIDVRVHSRIIGTRGKQIAKVYAVIIVHHNIIETDLIYICEN